jgi:hypothetical protein
MKTTLKVSDIININAPCMLKNWITNYFWDKKPVRDSYFKSKHYYVYELNCNGIDKDIKCSEIELLINNWVEKAKKDCKFIYLHEKEISVYPKINNFKDFCKEYDLPFKTISEMQRFVNYNFSF